MNGNAIRDVANNGTVELAGVDARPAGSQASVTIATPAASKVATGLVTVTWGFPSAQNVVCAGAVHTLEAAESTRPLGKLPRPPPSIAIPSIAVLAQERGSRTAARHKPQVTSDGPNGAWSRRLSASGGRCRASALGAVAAHLFDGSAGVHAAPAA